MRAELGLSRCRAMLYTVGLFAGMKGLRRGGGYDCDYSRREGGRPLMHEKNASSFSFPGFDVRDEGYGGIARYVGVAQFAGWPAEPVPDAVRRCQGETGKPITKRAGESSCSG